MITQTPTSQAEMTPAKAISELKKGNERFIKGKQITRNLMTQVEETAGGQYPFAAIVSCLDSRVSAELVFDQGVGDIFSGRVAGNIVNVDLLGSLEFACKLAGTKLIVVMGHTSCGAVKGAADGAELGNLTSLLSKIKPAVEAVSNPSDPALRNSSNIDFVNAVASKNVELTLRDLREKSPVLTELESEGEIAIVGAMYDVATGKVQFDDPRQVQQGRALSLER